MRRTTSPPTLSIIIPIYNERETLRQRLHTLQALPYDECLFVDGGSSDGSREHLQQAGASWLRSDKGRAVQMNHGAAHSTGDLLLFLHIDTDINTGGIAAMREAMNDE
ncbi:MAG: glycosyltransferase, partial [Mariprofundaceae bacterium]|nr:glycosyltransferase [Mariprofundaceae bacterium]